MKIKKITMLIMAAIICLSAVAGCSAAQSLSAEQFNPYISEIDAITYPSGGIIALGEATHGNKEFTELKREVFEQLIEQEDVRAFVIEGDFGGSQKVNDYIQGGAGDAGQAAGEIGFAIYRTREMTDLLDWMRDFNAGRAQADQIRFYGYDMQRYDNNKEKLYEILRTGAPQLCEQYESLLSGITDETMYDMDKDTVKQLLEQLDSLAGELEGQKETIIAAVSEEQYDLAYQYAKCIAENTQLRTANNYGTLRDGFMAERVKWIYEYEAQHYGSGQIFITGHNSHIGKTNATVGVEKSMGQILSEWYGAQYYTIGTEFNSSTFLAPDAGSGERREFTVQNSGDDRLAVLLAQADMETLYLNISEASSDPDLTAYLEEKQSMSAVGETFSDGHARIEKMYTQKISVSETYDGIIFFNKVTPSEMLSE